MRHCSQCSDGCDACKVVDAALAEHSNSPVPMPQAEKGKCPFCDGAGAPRNGMDCKCSACKGTGIAAGPSALAHAPETRPPEQDEGAESVQQILGEFPRDEFEAWLYGPPRSITNRSKQAANWAWTLARKKLGEIQ